MSQKVRVWLQFFSINNADSAYPENDNSTKKKKKNF